MNTKIETNEMVKIINRPWWFMFRGAMMFVFGSLLLIFSILAPNVEMLGVASSWLLFSSILIMVFGVFRCIDAFASDNAPIVIMNMQSGIIDLVCGFVILTKIGEEVITLSLLIYQASATGRCSRAYMDVFTRHYKSTACILSHKLAE